MKRIHQSLMKRKYKCDFWIDVHWERDRQRNGENSIQRFSDVIERPSLCSITPTAALVTWHTFSTRHTQSYNAKWVAADIQSECLVTYTHTEAKDEGTSGKKKKHNVTHVEKHVNTGDRDGCRQKTDRHLELIRPSQDEWLKIWMMDEDDKGQMKAVRQPTRLRKRCDSLCDLLQVNVWGKGGVGWWWGAGGTGRVKPKRSH